ncbi:MAG TPA: hypothetical protein VF815_20265 [Myxococcaceae bacterium]|jgi:hypothetical protein
MRRALSLTALAFLSTACAEHLPTQEEIDAARAKVEAGMTAASQARGALELLGILPVYECGESRKSFVSRVSASMQVGCVTASTESLDATTDAVVLAFGQGCEVREHKVTGQTAFKYSGGEDRMELRADLRQLKVDDRALQAEVGYGTCGDESRFFALAQGTLPGKPEYSYKVDGQVGKRSGVPIIGGTSLVFNGPGEITGPEGTNALTFTELLYELGDYAPKEGSALLKQADGGTVKVTFSSTLWRLGEMELVIDDKDPVTVPIVQ